LAQGISSNPISEISSGIRKPASRSAAFAPIATLSLATKTAVNSLPRSQAKIAYNQNHSEGQNQHSGSIHHRELSQSNQGIFITEHSLGGSAERGWCVSDTGNAGMAQYQSSIGLLSSPQDWLSTSTEYRLESPISPSLQQVHRFLPTVLRLHRQCEALIISYHRCVWRARVRDRLDPDARLRQIRSGDAVYAV
jgi:hypothetical protein